MKNAKEELIRLISDKTVKALQIRVEDENYNDKVSVNLRVGFNSEETAKVLEALDFEYDNGYGSQQIFGTVWFTDGTWADRGEYDGSEWWQHHVCPPIPPELEQLYVDEKAIDEAAEERAAQYGRGLI